MLHNKTLRIVLILVVVLVAVIETKDILLPGKNVGSLAPGSYLSGAIEPELVTPGSSTLPVENKGFKIVKAVYEDNSQWVIVTVSKSGNNATMILEKVNNVYSVVSGPGTIFPLSSTYSMPADVVSYLNNNGLVLNANQ